jgi:hypothetical protein
VQLTKFTRVDLIVQSWLLLARIDLVMKFRTSETLRRIVRGYPVHTPCSSNEVTIQSLCHAMDIACVFYFKRVLCLQCSAATVILIRKHGFGCELVTGVQILPYEFHA